MKPINPGIFKSYDIRGLYPEEINEKNIYQIVQGALKYILEKTQSKNPRIIVGRDMRISGPTLYPILLKALTDADVQVADIGVVSTPTMYFATFHDNYDAGIQLSASHNPPNYNGLKMVINSPHGLIKIGKSTGMEKVKEYALEGIKLPDQANGTITQIKDILKAEVKNAYEIVGDLPLKPFKIVADAANAMGSSYLNALFETLPGELVRMNFELDGSFPAHQPNPLIKENVADLQKKVIEEHAHLGLAPDGDGDRMFFVDEKGEIVPASIITALVAREMLKTHPGATILYDIRYTMTPKKIIAENGGKSDITKVGHAFITEKMNQTGAIFGGESSGHYFFKATGNAESQLPVILTVLQVMTREDRSLSSIVEELMRSYESGEYNFETDSAKTIIEKIKNTYNDGSLSDMDGISVEYPNWRFGVRSSNTEPLLRLNVEAETRDMMESKRDELIKLITNSGAKLAIGH